VAFDAEKTEAILFSRWRSNKKLGNETIKVAPGIEKNFNHQATRWLGVWLDNHLTLKEHHYKMMNNARIRSLRGKFGLTPENVRKIQVAAVRHRRYATRAYGLPLGHPIGDGIRNPTIDKSIFGKLSNTAKDGVISHTGQDVEYTWTPACIERLAIPPIIESRDKAERSATTIEEESTRCIWANGSRDEQGNVGAAAVWRQGNKWTGLKFCLG
jgi:hypothetical protein